MPVTVTVDGKIFTVNSTDDPEVAKKKARRALKEQSGDYSAKPLSKDPSMVYKPA